MARSGFDARDVFLRWDGPSPRPARRRFRGIAKGALAIFALFVPACVFASAATWFAYSVVVAMINGIATSASIRCCRNITVLSQSPTFWPLIATWAMIGLASAIGAYALFQLALGLLRGR